jgi:hypothetical protein
MGKCKKIFLWLVLPIVIVLAVVEAVWAEAHRLVTDSKFVSVIRANFSRIKQIYLEDIWK